MGESVIPPARANVRPQRAGRLRYLDSLRGLAALLVVWLHVAQTYHGIGGEAPVGGQWLYRIAQDLDVGRIGVVVFFLISGFVVPFSFRDDRQGPISDFFIRRAFRIFPAYWLSVPFGAWATYWLWQRPFGPEDFLVNLSLLQDVLGFRPAQGVYWTLFVEWVFYALCALLFARASLHKPARIGWLAAILLLGHSTGGLAIWLGAPLDKFLVFLMLHIAVMLCGTFLRLVLLHEGASVSRSERWWLAGLLSYLLVVLPAGTTWALGFFNNYLTTALGLALFLAGTTFLRVENRLGDALGAISYPVYLFHLAVYLPLYGWLLRQPADSWWRTQHLGVYLIVCLGLTIAVATVVHRYVEQPGIEAGRRCAAWWARRSLARFEPAAERIGS